MHREKTAMRWFDVEIKDKQNERESVCFCHYCVQNKGRWQKMNQCHCSRESTECSVLTRLKQTQKHKKRSARVRVKCHIKHRENKARGWSRSSDKKMIWVREKKTDTSKERDSAGGRWSRLRWMEKKTAAARQDNFSHFSVGGQRGRVDVTRWSVTEWQRGRRGGEQEITQDVWESEGGRRRGGQERVHRNALRTNTL